LPEDARLAHLIVVHRQHAELAQALVLAQFVAQVLGVLSVNDYEVSKARILGQHSPVRR